ncbi:MAG: hypothetical protein M0C28_39910 [Candidatus Moduliflexus flocculans]|nr:hypothetical protein [Candidatus Moduliflexus flocculans]
MAFLERQLDHRRPGLPDPRDAVARDHQRRLEVRVLRRPRRQGSPSGRPIFRRSSRSSSGTTPWAASP